MASGRLPIEDAPDEGRELLGALLAQRRKELGYTHWPAFARDRLPPTPQGNPNTRLLADIEKAYRKRFPEPTLRHLAQAYQVDYRSVIAVAYLRSRTLVPLRSAAPDVTPPTTPERAAADRPWFDQINERRVVLAARGITDPSGAQMFPDSPDDAKAWDGVAYGMDIGDRVWLIAELRRRAATRNGNSGTNVTGA